MARGREGALLPSTGAGNCQSRAERKSIFIEKDSNSKLGSAIIPEDPHKQSLNGKVPAGIINRHGLIVANGLNEKCSGLITRRRETKN